MEHKEHKGEVKTNSMEHARIVVGNLYMSGTDSRQVKNGKTGKEKLIELLLEPRNISTCGIFTLLKPEDMKLIHDKSRIRELEYPEIRKRVAKVILENANKPEVVNKNTKIYCRVSDYGIELLKDIINGTAIYKPRDVKVNFNLRNIFEHTERQKTLGSYRKN
jgi:hypothetical protein